MNPGQQPATVPSCLSQETLGEVVGQQNKHELIDKEQSQLSFALLFLLMLQASQVHSWPENCKGLQ